jgi:hypothetical protein
MSYQFLGRSLLIVWVACAPLAWADDAPQTPTEKRTVNGNREIPAASTSLNPTSASTYWEVYKTISIAAGSLVYLDSQIDFSKSSQIAVSARCTAGVSAATSMDNLDFQAFWAVSGTTLFGVVEHLAGSKFAYWDAGGGTFQVYGSQLRLAILNNGSSSITLDQVVIFTPVPPASTTATTSTPSSKS